MDEQLDPSLVPRSRNRNAWMQTDTSSRRRFQSIVAAIQVPSSSNVSGSCDAFMKARVIRKLRAFFQASLSLHAWIEASLHGSPVLRVLSVALGLVDPVSGKGRRIRTTNRLGIARLLEHEGRATILPSDGHPLPSSRPFT